MSRRGEHVRKIESPVTKKQFHQNDDDIKVLKLTKMTTERRVRTWRSQPMFFPADLAYQVISNVFSAVCFCADSIISSYSSRISFYSLKPTSTNPKASQKMLKSAAKVMNGI